MLHPSIVPVMMLISFELMRLIMKLMIVRVLFRVVVLDVMHVRIPLGAQHQLSRQIAHLVHPA